MIPRELLTATLGRAPGIITYGGPAMKKTLAVHTLPPPIRLDDFEGGSAPLAPWIRAMRSWDALTWTKVTQDERQRAFDAIPPERQSTIKPAPYIDVVYYNNLIVEAYTTYVMELGNFDVMKYSSLALDSTLEFTNQTQTFSKGKGNEDEPMAGKQWMGAQERAAIAFRRIRNYRDAGIFVYMTGSEQIDKDYVTAPMATKKGTEPEEPYSVKGTVNVPGKLVAALQHICDLQFHARPVNGEPVWISSPEPLPGGTAHWEAKDRFGRLTSNFHKPNFRLIFDQIYGQETRKAIYAHGIRTEEARNLQLATT